MTKSQILAVTAAMLLIGATTIPAAAIDLNAGGVHISTGSGGTTVGVGSGGTSATATVGGGGGNVASAGVGTNGGGASVGVGTNNGPLLATASDGGTNSANVNLGGMSGLGDTINGATGGLGPLVGSGLPPIGDGAGGIPKGLSPVQLASGFSALSGAEQQQLKVQCRSVLINPIAFERDLVMLCRMIGRLHLLR